MNWKSIGKQVVIGLAIMALGALLARKTDFGKKLFGTA